MNSCPLLNLEFLSRVALPIRLLLGSTYILLLTVSFSLSWAAGQPPNIVLILTDDQSWNGTSVQMDPNVPGSKSDFYQTPRLEEIAAAGMRFANGYSSSPVCAPTRAAIQTGMSPAQLQMTDLPQALPPGSNRWKAFYENLPLTPPAPEAFDPDQLTLPRIIKQANSSYVTAHYGKWHLAVPSSTTPQASGYEFGQDVTPLPADEVDPWGVFSLANMANSFMQDRVASSEPFFVQLSYRALHPPVRSRQVIRDKYAALPPGTVHDSIGYAAMTEDLDTSFGMVLDKISELGIENDTYVIFVSDNGAPVSLSSSAPLKFGKATIREGGIRSPYIIKGPNIQEGSVIHVPVTTTDLFSTVAELAGFAGSMPSDVEGASLVPVLENAGQLPAGVDHLARKFHEGGELYWHWPTNFGIGQTFRTKPSSAVRDGDYKLYLEYAENSGTDQVFLFNLAMDIGESSDLAASMPAKTAEMRAMLDNYLAAVDASFAFDIKQNVTMEWDASQPGAESSGWRSTIDLNNKGRETWKLGGGVEEPQILTATAHQPGLPKQAFNFDGSDIMRRLFFQVGDDGPRRNTIDPGSPDFDRSATMEFWIRLDTLTQEQILFESGGVDDGISVTLGDADSDGLTNDVRFRVQGFVGTDGGDPNQPPQELTVTAKVDRFANPVRDFLHVVTVFNDDPNDRYGEIYVNGALAARVNGLLGVDQSLQWDGYDGAGLGNVGGSELGGNSGTGDMPFVGGFQGDMALVRFRNHAIFSSQIASNYNSVLGPADFNIEFLGGDTEVPAERPTNLSLGEFESSNLMVIHERGDILDDPLSVDAIISGATVLNDPNDATPGQLAAGTNFSSFLIQIDPIGSNGGTMESVVGSIDFEGEILAILFDSMSLVSADAIVGSIGDYGDAADRGLMLGTEGFLDVSSNQKTLSFSLTVPGDEMLQFRVLTQLISEADFNADGVVDSVDLSLWESAYGLTDVGDANSDGDTNGLDFPPLAATVRRRSTCGRFDTGARTVDSGDGLRGTNGHPWAVADASGQVQLRLGLSSCSTRLRTITLGKSQTQRTAKPTC